MKKKILLLSGDPNSINSELIFKTWKKLNKTTRKSVYLISNFNLMKAQFKKLRYPIKIIKIKNLDDEIKGNFLKIINVDILFKNSFDVPLKSRSKFVIESLNIAHQLALRKEVKGIINCAIDKKLLMKNGFGVTEYLASKCKIKNNKEVMLIKNEKLAIAPITTHINVKQIVKNISAKKIVNKAKTIEKWYKNIFNFKPKIGILGLNPHNAELRNNSEEVKIVIPAIKKLKMSGLRVSGPLVSDTLFINNYKNFDVVIGMFHDQVLAPFKALFKFNAINITLGLEYLRVSPDHGTATNMIGKNKSNPESLIECVNFVNKFGK